MVGDVYQNFCRPKDELVNTAAYIFAITQNGVAFWCVDDFDAGIVAQQDQEFANVLWGRWQCQRLFAVWLLLDSRLRGNDRSNLFFIF